ncbi:hypothetical protein ACH5RR_040361 [Cinchona calisaya]|uniref:Bifunctional inhibitor/plant lipid transfer protein/seed storage helical domain-containing protein n=1 Tax=Cinchona calisaya TaxID=153742 RepID=A0ABD2XWS7_9GENT
MAEIRELVRSWIMMIIMILLFLCLYTNSASAAPSEAQCKLEKKLGVNACKEVLYGKPPSSDCCERIRVTDIECVCPVITPKLAALVDVNRAIRLIEGCGRIVPRHFKCGSITTP